MRSINRSGSQRSLKKTYSSWHPKKIRVNWVKGSACTKARWECPSLQNWELTKVTPPSKVTGMDKIALELERR